MSVDSLDDGMVTRYESMPLRLYVIEVFDAVESSEAASEPRVATRSCPRRGLLLGGADGEGGLGLGGLGGLGDDARGGDGGGLGQGEHG